MAETHRPRRTSSDGVRPLRPVRWRTFDGVLTRVLETEGSTPTVVLLHGFSDTAESWRDVLDVLESEGHRAVSVDLPGYGKASDLADGPVTPQFTAFVAAVAREYTEDGRLPVLVGNSLGGYVALIAAADSEAVAGVVAISPAGFGQSRLVLRAARASQSAALPTAVGALPPVLVHWAAARLVTRLMVHQGRDGEALTIYAGQFSSRDQLRRVVGSTGRVAAEAILRPLIPDIDTPVLILWGDRDRLLPVHPLHPLLRCSRRAPTRYSPASDTARTWSHPSRSPFGSRSSSER